MPSTSESYRAAALEHLERAQDLFAGKSFFLCQYVAGLAVECHLRARIRVHRATFDAHHDLDRLARQSGFYDIVPASETDRFSTAFGDLNRRWRSNHRFYSERQFLDYMAEIRAEFGVKGDRWKNMARSLMNRAHWVIRQGEAKWPNR